MPLGTPPRHIAMVIGDMAGGGAQRVVIRLAAQWLERGHRVSIVTMAGPENDVVALPTGVERIVLGGVGTSGGLGPAGRLIGRVWRLRRAISRLAPDVCVSFIAETNVLCVLATRGLAIPLVISERNDPARQSLGRAWDTLRRRFYRYAEAVTANSPGAVETLAGFVPRSRLYLVPNPLDCGPAPDHEARTALVLMVGRLAPQKAYDVMLNAWALSRARENGWRLAVLGDGPLRDALAAQASRLGVEDSVDWHGYVDPVAPWYAKASVYALPSRFEGTSNALMEAMAAALPAVISRSCDEAGTLIEDGETGLRVPVDDPAALAEALDRLCTDADLRRQLGAAARKRVIEAAAPQAVFPAWDTALADALQKDALQKNVTKPG